MAKVTSGRGLWPLASICGFLFFVNCAQFYNLGTRFGSWWTLLSAFFLAPVIGYLYLSFSAFFIYVAGKLIHGQATYSKCRLALAWSYVPLVINVVTWLFLIFSFPQLIFTNYAIGMPMSASFMYFVLMLYVAQLVGAIWSLIIFFYCLAVVQKFSILRAVVNVVIATLICSICLVILWILILNALVYLK